MIIRTAPRCAHCYRRSPEAIPGEGVSLPVGRVTCQRMLDPEPDCRAPERGLQTPGTYNSANGPEEYQSSPQTPTGRDLVPWRRCSVHHSGLPHRLWRSSATGSHRASALRVGCRAALRCGLGEEQQDGVPVRSSTAMDVRQQFISSRGLSAVLVFIAASRATDGSLEEQSTHAQSTKDVIRINHRPGKAS
jgi:hypothetical protein